MNAERRKELAAIKLPDMTAMVATNAAVNVQIELLEQALQDASDTWSELLLKIDDEKTSLEQIRDDEQEAFDNLPESMQNGDKGQAMQEAIDNIEAVVGLLETMIDTNIPTEFDHDDWLPNLDELTENFESYIADALA